jgi:hypothetical protein
MPISQADRDQAAAYLAIKLIQLAYEARQTVFDASPQGFGPDLDAAEMRMGGGGPRLAYYALAEYYALLRIGERIATRVDTQGHAVDGDRQTIFDNVLDLLARQATVIAGYGYPVDMTGIDESLIGSTVAGLNPGDVVGAPPFAVLPAHGLVASFQVY